MKICLDAGHFGKYNQSPVNRNYWESEMTCKAPDGGTWGKLKSGAGWINIGVRFCKRL